MEKSKLDLMAFGWALSAALVVLLIGSLRNFIEGVFANVVLGWITFAVLVTNYNRPVRS